MISASLLTQHCTVVSKDVPPLSEAQVQAHLAQSPEVAAWQFTAGTTGAIERAFDFKNYHETLAFVNAVAWICHQEDHHPTLTVTYNRCVVRFDTHTVGGVSVNDFICAAKVNALLAR